MTCMYKKSNVNSEIFRPQWATLTQFSKKAIFYSFTISSVNFYLNLGEQKSVQSVFFTHFWNRTVGTLWVYGGLMSIFWQLLKLSRKLVYVWGEKSKHVRKHCQTDILLMNCKNFRNLDQDWQQWYFVTKIVLTYCEKKLF